MIQANKQEDKKKNLVNIDTPKVCALWVIPQNTLKQDPGSFRWSNSEFKNGSTGNDFDMFAAGQALKTLFQGFVGSITHASAQQALDLPQPYLVHKFDFQHLCSRDPGLMLAFSKYTGRDFK